MSMNRGMIAAAAGLILASGIGGGVASASTPPPVACGTHVFLSNTTEHWVDQWNSTLNYFIVETSGHTDLCEVFPKVIQGITFYELESYGVAGAGNDCVSGLTSEGVIGLNGCATGKTTELWANYSGEVLNAKWVQVVSGSRTGNPMSLSVADGAGQAWQIVSG